APRAEVFCWYMQVLTCGSQLQAVGATARQSDCRSTTRPRWLSSVVPGAFAGPWTPLPPPLPGANPFRGGPGPYAPEGGGVRVAAGPKTGTTSRSRYLSRLRTG